MTDNIAILSQEQVEDIIQQTSDKRSSRRFAFPTVQLISPYNTNMHPEESTFQRTCCHDLSIGGISFIWPRYPTFSFVLLMLKTAAEPILVKACVVHVREMNEEPVEYLVGCRFEGRVEGEEREDFLQLV